LLFVIDLAEFFFSFTIVTSPAAGWGGGLGGGGKEAGSISSTGGKTVLST